MQDVQRLFADDISEAEQIEIISKLNLEMFTAEALYALASKLILDAKFVPDIGDTAVDLVGTGGDGFKTLNFSTLGCLVAAGAGTKIAKHGNRSVTSKCGGFDLLEQLGVKIPLDADEAVTQYEKNNITFLFAQYFHPVVKKVMAARKHFASIGEKTIFNCIGPLINPSKVKRIVAGVFVPELVKPYIEVLQKLGVKSAYVVHGSGLDEVTLTGATMYAKLAEGKISYGEFLPDDFGYPACDIDELVGGDPAANKAESLLLLNNKLIGAKRNMVVTNAAVAIQVGSDFELSLTDAIALAEGSLTSGKALKKLHDLEA